LRDNGHPLPAYFPQFGWPQAKQLDSLEAHRASHHLAARSQKSHQCHAESALAAARLSHQAECLTLLHFERHIADHFHHVARLGAVTGRQVINLE